MVDGVKKILYNIHDLLSPRALAFWAMDDGSLSPYRDKVVFILILYLTPPSPWSQVGAWGRRGFVATRTYYLTKGFTRQI